jgi:phospholipase/carboxylesterase
LRQVARMMDPHRLPDLVASLDRFKFAAVTPPPELAATWQHALRACTELQGTISAENPMLQAYRAMRHYSRALEALTMMEGLPAVDRYLLEPWARDRVPTRTPTPDHGVFHSDNETNQRGGYSVYVPPSYTPDQPTPVIMALHGGAGHGRLFLWNWIPEARSRNLIIVAPTATGSTWSLMDPDIDSTHLANVLTAVRQRWTIDPAHLLLSGMSDGGTFTLLSGLASDSPFTHLAPFAATFHPMLLAVTEPERISGLPIYLTHGALDWMFPVSTARTAHRTLQAAGAAITYQEVADLSHAYPRDIQPAVLDWLLGPVHA